MTTSTTAPPTRSGAHADPHGAGPGGWPGGAGRASVSERVLGILAVFTPDRRAMTLSDISRHTGLPVATAHRLVGELARWGALERDDSGVYRIGLRLWEVGSLAPRGLGLRESAMPFLEDLYEATHQNVQLAILDGLDVVYLEKISGRKAVNVLIRVGARFTAPATGVGLAMLAHADHALQERAIKGPLRRYTAKTITSGERLRRVLAEVRRTGVAVSDGQVELVSASVAAPIRGPDGTVVAALSIVVPSKGFIPQMYAPAVHAAARGVSRVLGAPR